MYDVLREIIAHKEKEVAEAKAKISRHKLEKQLENCHLPIYSMKEALRRSDSGIIAECKRRSPGKNWIFQHADAAQVAAGYQAAGASAVSVLTDKNYFGGTLSDLQQATKRIRIPALRKEFVIDEYQIVEARLAGASAILLIASVLSVKACTRLTAFAMQLGMETLLELHDESELDYITPQTRLIGINNRNLGTFVTDVEKSFKLASRLPKDAIWVSESGISTPQALVELRQAGYRGFLIGENFMKTMQPGDALQTFINQMDLVISDK